jgi:hypothetical protein
VKLDWALLAYSALAPPGGGAPSALGIGSDTFYTTNVAGLPPGLQPPPDQGVVGVPFTCAVVARILISRAEAGRPRIVELAIQETDGGQIFRAQLTIVAAPAPDLPPGWDLSVNVIAPLTIAPKRFGHHSVELFLDNAHAKTIPFRILEQP